MKSKVNVIRLDGKISFRVTLFCWLYQLKPPFFRISSRVEKTLRYIYKMREKGRTYQPNTTLLQGVNIQWSRSFSVLLRAFLTWRVCLPGAGDRGQERRMVGLMQKARAPGDTRYNNQQYYHHHHHNHHIFICKTPTTTPSLCVTMATIRARRGALGPEVGAVSRSVAWRSDCCSLSLCVGV